jgi:hypothetical protein
VIRHNPSRTKEKGYLKIRQKKKRAGMAVSVNLGNQN